LNVELDHFVALALARVLYLNAHSDLAGHLNLSGRDPQVPVLVRNQ
jgi:hypothetical protein